jgi:cytochrome c-type biogenesis protein
MKKTKKLSPANRIWELDAFRGLCILGMVVVHLVYDLAVLYRIIDWQYPAWFDFIQHWGGVLFLVLSGICVTLGSRNIRRGLIVILFGLNYMGLLNLRFFRGTGASMERDSLDFFSAALLGMVFSIGWTPCVGVFLGSALMLASQQGHVLEGMLMLLSYSAGLGVPFLFSAVLIDRLKGAFNWIKAHYRQVNLVSGALLVMVGVLMATGLLGRFLTVLS